MEEALELGRGVLHLAHVDEPTRAASRKWTATASTSPVTSCGRSPRAPQIRTVSVNSPLGWCPTCEGLGVQRAPTRPSGPRSAADAARRGDRGVAELDGRPARCSVRRSLARHGGFRSRHAVRQLTPIPAAGHPARRRRRLAGAGRGRGVNFQYKGLLPGHRRGRPRSVRVSPAASITSSAKCPAPPAAGPGFGTTRPPCDSRA